MLRHRPRSLGTSSCQFERVVMGPIPTLPTSTRRVHRLQTSLSIYTHVSGGGRYWDRTSDLCRVKVCRVVSARPPVKGRGGRVPGRRVIRLLVISRQLSVNFIVMWTRCGREAGIPAGGESRVA